MRYNFGLKEFARENRKYGTKGEALLWKKVLRAKMMNGYQFNRQFIIGNYIVDFICRKLKLIIEIDGSSHVTKCSEDKVRQDYLENQGFTVLRFSEGLVIFRIDDVINDIFHTIISIEEKQKNPPLVPPFSKGDEN